MNIMVEGNAKKFYVPDEVVIGLDFYTRTNSYETALQEGTKDVELFINEVLEKIKFSKQDMKTQSFNVYEEKRYDYEKKEEIKLGYAYTQRAMLKFDYSMDKIAEFMDETSKLKNSPKYSLNFNIKDIQKAKNEVMAEAYLKAKEKAEVIANVANKTLKECLKTDFRPFEESVVSNSSLDLPMFRRKENAIRNLSTQETIKTIFTPEDVEISETLYCLWLAE